MRNDDQNAIPFLTNEMVEHQAALDLQQFARVTGKPLSFPIYPEEVLSNLWDVDTRFEEILFDPDGKDILARYVPGKKCVLAHSPPGAHQGRLTFSLAHEVGHVSLHSYISDALHCIPNTPKAISIERQADWYASALLMPQFAVHEVLRELGYSKLDRLDLSKHADHLCDYFGVSRQTLEIRLVRMGIRVASNLYRVAVGSIANLDSYFNEKDEARVSWSFKGP